MPVGGKVMGESYLGPFSAVGRVALLIRGVWGSWFIYLSCYGAHVRWQHSITWPELTYSWPLKIDMITMNNLSYRNYNPEFATVHVYKLIIFQSCHCSRMTTRRASMA